MEDGEDSRLLLSSLVSVFGLFFFVPMSNHVCALVLRIRTFISHSHSRSLAGPSLSTYSVRSNYADDTLHERSWVSLFYWWRRFTCNRTAWKLKRKEEGEEEEENCRIVRSRRCFGVWPKFIAHRRRIAATARSHVKHKFNERNEFATENARKKKRPRMRSTSRIWKYLGNFVHQ